MLQKVLQAAFLLAAGVAGITSVYFIIVRSRELTRTPKNPKRRIEVGTLKDIYVYPIKSCAPVRVEKAECTVLGLKDGWLRDRILMVVNNKYNFITARARPQLFLVQPSVSNSILTLQHKDMEPIHLDLAEV